MNFWTSFLNFSRVWTSHRLIFGGMGFFDALHLMGSNFFQKNFVGLDGLCDGCRENIAYINKFLIRAKRGNFFEMWGFFF